MHTNNAVRFGISGRIGYVDCSASLLAGLYGFACRRESAPGCGGEKVQITQLILSYKYSNLRTACLAAAGACLSGSGNVRASVSAGKNKLKTGAEIAGHC